MTSMREKMVRAIGAHLYGYVDPADTPMTWDKSLDAVDVMLEVIGDPTKEMQVAGGLKLEAMMFEGDPDWTGVIFTDVAHVFRAMISEARKG